MPIRLRPLALTAIFVFAVAAGVPYALLSFGIRTAEFKDFAEDKVGDFLKAEVRIGKIRAGFFNRIKFSSLRISPDVRRKSYYRIEVDEITFRYSLKQLLTRNLNVPSSVTLKSPRILLNDAGLSYNMIQSFHFNPGGGQVHSSFEMAGGELNLKIPGFQEGLALKEIQGYFAPQDDKKLRGEFTAVLSGAFSGKIELSGESDPASDEMVFDFSLTPRYADKDAEGSIRGKIRRQKDRIIIESLRSDLYGYELFAKASVLHPGNNPEIIIESKIRTNSKKTFFNAALRNEMLTGNFETDSGALYPFSGKIIRKGLRLDVKKFKLGTDAGGEGQIDFETRKAFIQGEGVGRRRVSLQFDFAETAELQFLLEHIPLVGLDLVTSGNIRFSGARIAERKMPWEIHGEYETDYFILGYTPFDDLKGDFKINNEGFRKITGSWGKVFKFSGDVFLERGRRDVQLTLRTDGFDLREVKKFAPKPLARELGGMLEGKLTVDGPLHLPEIAGQFTIKNGLLGKIDYDRGIIQFRGFPPYLRLNDSRILRGRTTLNLQGAINLSLRNIFHGVSIQTPDNLVIWKGLELNVAEDDEAVDFEINAPIKKLPVFGIKAGQGSASSLPEETDGNNNPNEHYISAGPKFKF